uniref:OBP5 n=1 Tax=Corythucha ciliata TaxID=369451 RepID=A0A3G2YUW5_CORCT|nr:OBP5 [Corythucha ciliata]
MLFTVLLVLSVQLLNVNSLPGFYIEHLSPIVKEPMEKCLGKYSLKIVEDELESTLIDLDDPPKKIECFLHCFLEEVGVMDNLEIDQEFLEVAIGLLVRRTKGKESQQAKERDLNTCFENIKGDKCERAFAFFKCINLDEIEMISDGE